MSIPDPSSYPSLFPKNTEIRKDDYWLPLLAALFFRQHEMKPSRFPKTLRVWAADKANTSFFKRGLTCFDGQWVTVKWTMAIRYDCDLSTKSHISKMI